MIFYPDLMKMNGGAAVTDAETMRARREELLEILKENAYGDMPGAVPVTGKILSQTDRCSSGTATLYEIELNCEFKEKSFSFPVRLFVPNSGKKKKLIIVINFGKDPYHRYIPAEEITDSGFAFAYIYYEDVTADNDDFSDRLAAFFPRENGRSPGKISMWAWSVSRAVDYLITRDDIDGENIGIIGHSRLGKTVLWCAANDERVKFVCSNDSGCMGAAYDRTKHEGGEKISDITGLASYWFCDNFLKYSKSPEPLPFDQHFLLACIAPRCVLVNSASLDDWADPVSEQFSCLGASPAWEAYGKTGYKGSEKPYGDNEGCLYGEAAYYKRYGVHFLGRKDWQNFMKFIKINS